MDLLLRHASLIDGTGAPARAADVAITGDRISAVGDAGSLEPDAGTQVVDLDGLTLAPGFIDIHTHYDAQILWDGDLTPSSWHGVTSVVMGNCGFAVAPNLPEHRDTIVRTFENVEGMSMEALEEGIDWCFETIPEYLDAIDKLAKRINVGAFVGHSTLRLFVLGGEERAATDDEVATMKAILREAIDAGAVGFSTSRQPNHQGAYGRPVPSRFADVSEIEALTSVLGEAGKGVVEVSIGPGLFVDQFSELAVKYGVPITWTALVARADKPGAALRTVERGAALPGEVYPQIACRPIVMQTSMADPTPLGEIDEWKEVLALPRDERADLYRDASWRDRARPTTLETWAHRWSKIDVEETNIHARPRGSSPRRAGRRARHHPVRPDARPGARGRARHPVPGRHGQRRRRRDRRPARRQADVARAVRCRRPCQPAVRRLLLDPPARPLGPGAQGVVARGRGLAADRPPARGVPDPGARSGARRASSPTSSRSIPTPSAPLPSSVCTTNPVAPTACWSAAPESSHVGQRSCDATRR